MTDEQWPPKPGEWAAVKGRFEAKVMPEPNSGCWLWTASTSPKGYGAFVATDALLAARAPVDPVKELREAVEAALSVFEKNHFIAPGSHIHDRLRAALAAMPDGEQG